MTDIHLRLKEIRRWRNLSQEQLAEKLGISRQAVIALEQGTSLPSLPVLLAILRVLDLPLAQLLGDSFQPFKKLFNERASSTHLGFERYSTPDQSIRLRLWEDNASLYLRAEIPGVKDGDITVDLSPQHVLITAMRPTHRVDSVTVHLDEIAAGQLARIVGLPCPIDPDRASASFELGILHLTLPKFLPTAQRRITLHPKDRHGLQ